MVPRPLIIDCDPGVDDAIALLLAFASPELQLLGITTVAGNVPLPLTHTNARQICELAGRVYIPVYAGCARPMLRPLMTAEEVHGETGLGGATLPLPQMPLQPKHGVDFLIEQVMAAREPITLATLGPLTNLAIALIKAPAIAANIREVVFMGGAMTQGNITPSAEFNIFIDPHAAHVVFTSGLKLTMIGLDVTHTVLTTPERLERLRDIGTPVSRAAADLLAHYGMLDREKYGLEGSPLHDPCVIAYLLHPSLFTSRDLFVEVELNSDLTMGRTVVDRWQTTQRHPNMTVVQTIDAEGFYNLLCDRLSNL